MGFKLIIDAASLREGGGITHINEILNNISDDKVKFEEIIIFGSTQALSGIRDRVWLKKVNHRLLDRGGFINILLWKLFVFKYFLRGQSGVLFSPAGNYSGGHRPVAGMSRNMLVFEDKERRRFGFTFMRYKLLVLKRIQTKVFRKYELVIFISNYAKNIIAKAVGEKMIESPVIYHGVNTKFNQSPISQKNISYYTYQRPFKLLYVSPILPYKHQWTLIKAVSNLRQEGFHISLDLIGYHYKLPYKKFLKSLKAIENHGEFIFYHGKIPYSKIEEYYKSADGFIYCSTCENMPNILVEAMAAGLPIMCSDYGPMPEILGDSDFYFDPTKVESIQDTLRSFLLNSELRYKNANASWSRSKSYSWKRCSEETFGKLFDLTKFVK